MIRAHELPEAKDGRNPVPTTVEFQLRRMNRIAFAMFGVQRLIGEDPLIRFTFTPDDDYVQISMNVMAPADIADAEALVIRLMWDPEAQVNRSGMCRIHTWHGILAGFRASVMWVERPASVDSQGRADLPAGVGVGDRAADAEHVGDGAWRGITESAQPRSALVQAAKVPPMHADLQRLGYEL